LRVASTPRTYAAVMSADLPPTTCLPTEPGEARALTWLPLAVRYKLDLASLKLSLRLWQALPRSGREALVALAPGPSFERLARQAGAFDAPAREPVPASFAEYVARKALDKKERQDAGQTVRVNL
jgi:hypothetical protein